MTHTSQPNHHDPTLKARPLVLNGRQLTNKQVVEIAQGGAPVKLAPAGRERARLAHEAVQKIAQRRPIYGQSTGVGSNRNATVTAAAFDYIRLVKLGLVVVQS